MVVSLKQQAFERWASNWWVSATLSLNGTTYILVLISTGSDQLLNPSQGVDNFLEFLILFL